MATTRDGRALPILFGVLVFAVVSQVVDLLAGASEVGARVTVIVVAAVGAVLTGIWLVRRRRTPPTEPPTFTPVPEEVPDDVPDDPGAAGATSARG